MSLLKKERGRYYNKHKREQWKQEIYDSSEWRDLRKRVGDEQLWVCDWHENGHDKVKKYEDILKNGEQLTLIQETELNQLYKALIDVPNIPGGIQLEVSGKNEAVAHHIVPLQKGSDYNFMRDNIVLICHGCHNKVHYRQINSKKAKKQSKQRELLIKNETLTVSDTLH